MPLTDNLPELFMQQMVFLMVSSMLKAAYSLILLKYKAFYPLDRMAIKYTLAVQGKMVAKQQKEFLAVTLIRKAIRDSV